MEAKKIMIVKFIVLFLAIVSTADAWAAPSHGSPVTELVVFFAAVPGAPIAEQVVDSVSQQRGGLSWLAAGGPTAARFLLPFRARGAVRGAIAAQPDGPRARLERAVVLSYPLATDIAAVETALRQRPEVLVAERDHPVGFSAAPNDPFFAPAASTNDYQWGLHLLKLPQAWDWTTGHAYVGVADLGLDQAHPDLQANYRPHLSWDLQGNDADVDELMPRSGGGFVGGHGTHVSGIIAATPNNSIGGSGVCWNCSLLMGRGVSLTSQAISITWLVDHGVQVINASWGIKPTDAGYSIIHDAVEYAKQHDVLIVAASGNDLATAVEYPASDPGAIGVGGIKPDGTFWERAGHAQECVECGSNSGPDLDLVAPAENVRSTMYPGVSHNAPLGCTDLETPPSASTNSDGYGLCTGTSMSTPHVTGIAAILRSINPLLSKENVRDLLITNASQAGAFTNQLGYGIPNAAASVVEALGCANGGTLKNRLTPLFGFYSSDAADRFYTTPPQMALAALGGFLHEKCSHPGQQLATLADCNSALQPAIYESSGTAIASYDHFPGIPPCNISPCLGDVPRASVYVFTTEKTPFAGAPSLVPLYRLTYNPLNDSIGSTDRNRDVAYTTNPQGISLFTNAGYRLDGIEGYIFPRCTPDCAPAGTVKLYRRYNSTLDDFAIFPATELTAMESLGYLENGGPSLSDVLGYVYLNQDADGDGLIDGFEALIGTNPAVADTDGDGTGDGAEVQSYPYGDPLRAGADCRDRNPVASFTVTCAGYFCSFNAGASSDDRGIVSYAWSFGDGFTGSGATLTHTYSGNGTRTVQLTVTDESSQSAQTSHPATVPGAIAANPDSLSAKANTRRYFVDTELTANDTPGVTFVRAETVAGVTLGGLEEAGVAPEGHAYYYVPPAGYVGTDTFDYLISVDGNPPYTRGHVTVTITDDPPVAAFAVNRTGLTCAFDASGSSDDIGIASYAWTFGDGGTGSGKTPSHIYANRGTYTIVLTVTDTGGHTATASQPVTVDALPVAVITLSCAGRTCTFDGSGSTDDVGIVAYAWTFGDGQTGSSANATHTYATSGNFVVTLTVTDTIGQTGSATRPVSIDLNPTPCFTAVRDGLIITFNASCSTDDLGIASYTWSFGDASTGTGANISHPYATSGARTVQLTVTDTGGHTATTSQTVNPDAKPVANFTASCVQRTCSFNGTSSTDNQPIASYAWNFGDGTTGTGATPSRVYAAGGSYNVTLTVTDSVGQTNAKSNMVLVNRPPNAVNDSVSTPPSTAIDIAVLANDSDLDGNALTVKSGSLTAPLHGTASLNGNGTVHYVPTTGYQGTDTFQYQAWDGQDGSNVATVTVTTNTPPDARDDGWSTFQNAATNVPFSHMLSNDFDPNGDAVTLASFNTAGLTGTLDCSSGTWCRYTPPSWFIGTTSFTYTASDGKGGTDTATVRIKVATANNAPAPQTDTLETTRGVALPFTMFTLLANDSDPDGDVLSVTQILHASLTKFGTVTCTTPIYNCTYTPASGFTGVDTVSYRVSDGITFTDGQIRFVVKPPAPAVLDAREDQVFTTTNPTYISYTLLTSNDYDPAGGALTVVSVDTTGLLGTLDCTSYSTGCDYYRGTSDPTRFKYTVRNAQGTLDTTTVTLKPGNQSFNRAPVAANDAMTTTANTPRSFSIFDVLRNDYDPDNDQLNVAFVYATPNGHVSCTAPAYFCTYTPNANFTGTDTLTYWANDNTNSATATVTMTVRAAQAKDALVLSQNVPAAMTAGQSYPVSVTLKNVGSLSWSPVGAQCNAYRLGSLNNNWNPVRAELPPALAPGQEVTLNFNVTAPAAPGTYSFQWRMVHECVEWFGDPGPNVSVVVN